MLQIHWIRNFITNSSIPNFWLFYSKRVLRTVQEILFSIIDNVKPREPPASPALTLSGIKDSFLSANRDAPV